MGVKLDRTRCTDCGVCKAVCPVDIRTVGDRECVACGKCIPKCPEAAISFRAGKIVLLGNEATGNRQQATGKGKSRRLFAWLLALLVLLGTLVYFNLPNKSNEALPTEARPADLGNSPGQTLPDFTVQTLDGSTFSLSAHRGEVVALNLWATWCGPCVKELPIFEAFAAHPDAAVLAIHGPMITEDVPAWLAETDYNLPFAVDADGTLTALLGASNVLPHTVVLDRTGTVIYNAPGSITADLLEELYANAG